MPRLLQIGGQPVQRLWPVICPAAWRAAQWGRTSTRLKDPRQNSGTCPTPRETAFQRHSSAAGPPAPPPARYVGVGLQVGDAGAWAQSVFGTLRPAASRRLPVRMGAITNREIPHDHGTQSGQGRSCDFLEGITASGRRPARTGAPVKSPDVGVFVRPGRLPASVLHGI